MARVAESSVTIESVPLNNNVWHCRVRVTDDIMGSFEYEHLLQANDKEHAESRIRRGLEIRKRSLMGGHSAGRRPKEKLQSDT